MTLEEKAKDMIKQGYNPETTKLNGKSIKEIAESGKSSTKTKKAAATAKVEDTTVKKEAQDERSSDGETTKE